MQSKSIFFFESNTVYCFLFLLRLLLFEIASKFDTLNNLEEEIKSLKGRVADLERENADLKKANAVCCYAVLSILFHLGDNCRLVYFSRRRKPLLSLR